LEQGRASGYPRTIDFTILRKRVSGLTSFIKEVINNPSESEFMRNLRKSTKRRNAAQPMTMIDLFDESQPGYFGPRGSELISDAILHDLGEYIRKKDNIYDDLRFCGGVTGFISSVLVPEVAVHLIMEDMGVAWDDARLLMKESAAYGCIVNASVEVSDDEEDSDSDSSL
jgi:RTC4-like domain